MCTDVSRVDGEISNIQCNDLDFDGVFDGDILDGRLTFTARIQDYLNDVYPPGQYEVTITGFAGFKNMASASSVFILELIDPCDQPNSLTIP